MVRKTSVGYCRAKSAMKSHEPLPAKRSMSSMQTFLAIGAIRLTAAGANHGFRTWRYLTWSGGFTRVGMNR